MVTNRRVTEQRRRWYKPERCSICTRFIWFHSIALDEPVEDPEQRSAWLLCKPCYTALLVEIRRSSLNSPLRLRIALGLVAAERSPNAYTLKSPPGGSLQFQREFAWFTWFLVSFALLHLVILCIILLALK
jgi:hypothetical protein